MLCIATAIWIFLDKRSSLYFYDNVRTPQISKREGETYVYRKQMKMVEGTINTL